MHGLGCDVPHRNTVCLYSTSLFGFWQGLSFVNVCVGAGRTSLARKVFIGGAKFTCSLGKCSLTLVWQLPLSAKSGPPQTSASQIAYMNLRQELTPPILDEQLVARLAELANALDGNPSETLRAEFNKLADTDVPMTLFQGVYEGEDHVNFVRRVLRDQRIKPVPDVTREELVEIVRRAMKPDRAGLQEAYMAILDCNVTRPHASNLIFWPADYDDRSSTWGGGKPMNDYDPSPEQIVNWALDATEPHRRLVQDERP